MSTEILRSPALFYPESDGKPVGETDDHREIMFELIFVLTNLLRGREAYVAGNCLSTMKKAYLARWLRRMCS